MAVERRNFNIKAGVSITDEVVAIIAGLAATEVDGVDSLAGNLKNEVISRTGMNKLAKGVRVTLEEGRSVSIRLLINIEHGAEIPGVSTQVQEKVRYAVENMTGLTVTEVDIRIASVILEEKE